MDIGPVPWLGPLLLVSLWASSAPASLLRRLGEHILRFQESSALGLGLGPDSVTLPKEGWLEQPLDPFNASDRRSFLQRYWVNDQHWTSQDGPVFLHLGGEGSLGPGSVMRGHPANLAPIWGALVISLEHRFYGLSIPAEGLDMAQLRFLSSRHAYNLSSSPSKISSIVKSPFHIEKRKQLQHNLIHTTMRVKHEERCTIPVTVLPESSVSQT
ncbi:hypothetical protein E5288_WYG010696 [Bos mutus]|uniref:Thymus-specific serine protease n=1 Tax=Bos mutus TaxID=72004 RepID=A0A6B0RYS1_9CETA|nr:hypothetical protein [Bos mutus]